MKQFIQWSVIVLFPIAGALIGYWVHHHLKYFGITFITIGDVIGCYVIHIGLMFVVGLFVGGIWLEDKLR